MGLTLIVFSRCRSSDNVTPFPIRMVAVEMARAERRPISGEICARIRPTNHPAMTAVEEIRVGLRAD